MRTILIALPLIALAGCNKEPSVDVRNATPEEVAQKVRESGAEFNITPGKWQYAMTLVDMSAPGMPPAAVERMKQVMSRSKVVDKCLTPADVKDARATMGETPGNCKFDHYTMNGGSIDGQMICQHNGMTQDMTIKGTYAATETDVTVVSKTSGGSSPMGDMAMTMNMKGKRVGDCEPGSTGAAN